LVVFLWHSNSSRLVSNPEYGSLKARLSDRVGIAECLSGSGCWDLGIRYVVVDHYLCLSLFKILLSLVYHIKKDICEIWIVRPLCPFILLLPGIFGSLFHLTLMMFVHYSSSKLS
jgi:hypothetical protein